MAPGHDAWSSVMNLAWSSTGRVCRLRQTMIREYGGILDLDDTLLREMVATNYLATVWSVRSGCAPIPGAG